MTRYAGLPVPPGIVVTTSTYRRFVGDHSLDARITRELADVGEGPDAVAAASARLRKAFEAAPMSDELREEITAACALFGNAPVAARSSATAEDLPEASFAGQQDSILGVVGSMALAIAAVQKLEAEGGCQFLHFAGRAEVDEQYGQDARPLGRRASVTEL